MAKPTQGSVTSRPINMTGSPQGPSKTIPPLPGSVTPQPMVSGSGLPDEPALTPLPANHPNKSLDGKTYGHL